MVMNTQDLVCKHCGRIKSSYTRNGTAHGFFGKGCKVQPQGFHFYIKNANAD